MSRGAEDAAQASRTEADSDQAAGPAYFEITKGNPTPLEVGVLTAVIGVAEGNGLNAAEHPTGPRDEYGNVMGKLRDPWYPAPGSFLYGRSF